MPRILELAVRGSITAWSRLGFVADASATSISIGGFRVRFVDDDEPAAASWTVDGAQRVCSIDGLLTRFEVADTLSVGSCSASQHANGAIAVDSIVATTSDVSTTIAALEQRGGFVLKRRSEEIRPGVDMALFERSNCILELIGPILGPDDAGVVGSAKLWGLTVTVPVETFETFSARLKEKRLAGTARDAVQPGRRIVTCKASRELGVALAFITPHVGSSSSRL
jgi:hypothetical protein